MMRVIRWACLPILAVGFFCGNSSCAQAQSVQKIKVLTLLGRPLQVVIAETHGIFAKYGRRRGNAKLAEFRCPACEPAR